MGIEDNDLNNSILGAPGLQKHCQNINFWVGKKQTNKTGGVGVLVPMIFEIMGTMVTSLIIEAFSLWGTGSLII